jgi:hypothetical protein
VLSAELGAAPRVALFPAGRFAVLVRRDTYHEILTVAQQAKAKAACAEAEAARPGEGWLYAAPRLALNPFPHSFLCLLAAPFGRAAAAE